MLESSPRTKNLIAHSGVADVLKHDITLMIRGISCRLDGKPGVLTSTRPSRTYRRLRYGCRVADAIAGLDVSQTIVVR
jgi:DUF1009 family protein